MKRVEASILDSSGWQRVAKRFAIALLVVVALLLILGAVYAWLGTVPAWTGFDAAPVPQGYRPAKTLWDWLDLLIIPIVLALGAFLLNRSERRAEREIAAENREEDRRIAAERAEAEREISLDRQRQATLEAYLDQMQRLLLDRELRDSEAGDEVRTVARARTLAALRSLDPLRIEQVIRFLREADLLEVVSLRNAILSELDLSNVNLSQLDLQGADLVSANLENTKMTQANLIGADFAFANLEFARLENADLKGAMFHQANLSYARLTETDLRHAVVEECVLTRAKLIGADLRKAHIWPSSPGSLSRVEYDAETQWPDGFNPVAAGAVLAENKL